VGVLLSTFEPFDLHEALNQRNYITVLFKFFFLSAIRQLRTREVIEVKATPAQFMTL
jgi:hypothetical protein